jgi:hypothetical protein
MKWIVCPLIYAIGVALAGELCGVEWHRPKVSLFALGAVFFNNVANLAWEALSR